MGELPENNFLIDLPNPYDLEGPWMNIDSFPNREEAVSFAQRMFGADGEGRIGIVTDTMGC